MGMRRAGQRGLTLIEMVVSFTIMLTLSAMAVPLARVKVRTRREFELKWALRDMRQAIDKYKEACDAGIFGAIKQGTFCYPETVSYTHLRAHEKDYYLVCRLLLEK